MSATRTLDRILAGGRRAHLGLLGAWLLGPRALRWCYALGGYTARRVDLPRTWPW